MLGMVLGDESVDQPYLSVWPPLSMIKVALMGDAADGDGPTNDGGGGLLGFRDADNVRFRFFSEGMEGTCDGTGGGWGGSMML